MDSPILYLSSHIINNKADYYTFLRNVTFNGKWTEWVEYMLTCIDETSKRTLEIVETIKKERDKFADIIQEKLPSIYSSELVDVLFSQPYCKSGFLVDKKIGVRQTSANYLKELEKVGLITSQQVGKERLFLNQRLIDILK